MNLYIFSIYDQKAEAYLPPFTLPKPAIAVRTFKGCVNDNDHAFGANPHDYTLFQIGIFDDETGSLTDLKKSLGNGVEFIDPELSDDETGLFPQPRGE